MTDGTWRDHDPDDADAANGIAEITVATKDIVVNLATDATGALTSTAAQVKAAINADSAASALVSAYLYGNNAGAGIVPATPSRTYKIPAGTTGTPTFASTKVRLSDYLRGGTVYWAGSATATPPTLARTDARYITKGPFDMKVYRIGKDRSNNAVGVFLYCQQHAREWVTPITCLETAERLVRNYATDPTTKEYVDKLNIFILPSVNPDGGHYAFHDNSVQRKNMKIYCAPNSHQRHERLRRAAARPGASTSTATTRSARCSTAMTEPARTARTRPSPARPRRPRRRSRTSTGSATRSRASSSPTTSTPTAATSCGRRARTSRQGRVTLPAPNIGVEKYFFDVADTILSHIRSSRNTAILPQRVGPIADVLYSAAGNSADEQYYKRGIIAYSFEAGAQRIAVNPTTGAISRTTSASSRASPGRAPTAARAAHCGTVAAPNALLVNEGHDSTMEFAEGNFGMIQGALEYHNDVTPPATTIEYSAAQTGATRSTSSSTGSASRRSSTTRPTARRRSKVDCTRADRVDAGATTARVRAVRARC